jgi:hypothetical protein
MISSMTTVTPFTDEAYGLLEYGSKVILLFNGDNETIIVNAVAALRKKGVSVTKIILTCKTLGDFIANGIAHSGHSLDVRLEENPKIEDIIRYADTLAKSIRRFVLRLHTASDATIIRIFCSLHIPVLVDVRDESINRELLKDLTIEALLGPAPRASLDPVTALATSFKEPAVCLAAIYYEDPEHHLWSDGTSRLFLTESDMRRERPLAIRDREHWYQSEEYIRATNREYDLLERKTPCAFCDGFFLCKGYLSQFDTELYCKTFMNDFLDTLELKLCRQDNRAPCS